MKCQVLPINGGEKHNVLWNFNINQVAVCKVYQYKFLI